MTANGVTKEAENKLEKSGINVTALEDAVRRGDAASIMKSVKCKNCSDSEENGADLDGGVAGSKKRSNFHSASHQDYKDANKEYMGAVDKLGDELDNKKQTSAEAAALAADAKQKLARQEKILVQKKSDLAQVLSAMSPLFEILPSVTVCVKNKKIIMMDEFPKIISDVILKRR